MNKLVKSLSLGVCCLAVGAGAGLAEPSYQGHNLSYWAGQIDPHAARVIEINGVPVPEPVEETAIRHIGTNALPTLLRWIAQKDEVDAGCSKPSPGMRAQSVFGILGHAAQPAIPQLTALALKFPDRTRYDRCIAMLTGLAPESVPSLVQILAKGPDGKRFSVLDAVSIIDTNSGAILLPGVIKCLTGKSENLGWKAADELSRSTLPGDLVLPALMDAWPTASTAGRGRIFRCLYWSKYPAKEAVPLLRAGLADPDAQIRQEATWALQRIAPEVLPKKGR